MFYCSIDPAKLKSASKILNRTTSEISTDFFRANIYWCRVVLDNKWNKSVHKHSFFELHMPLSSSCEYTFDNKSISVSTGQLLLIPPGKAHKVVPSESFSEFVMAFEIISPVQLNKEFAATPFFLLNANDYLLYSIDHMLKNASEEKIGAKEAIKHQLALILIEIFQQTNSFSEFSGNITNDMRIKAAVDYIESNLSSHISGLDVAEHVHLSLRHMNRLTEKALSMTVAQLILSRKIRAAKKLMTDPEKSIEEIAEETGFSSQQQFSKVFHRLEGLTPTVYRKDIGK